jgi:protein-S-isoprenylcysteine O-methyltransferase Ste14
MIDRKNLLLYALLKYSAGAVLIGLMLFLPAGTLQYLAGWRFLGLLFGPMLVLGIVLLLKSPDLLAKRLKHGEKQDEQKKVIGLSALQFIAMFILAGLDYRFGWSQVPGWMIWLAGGILLVSYGLYGEVMRENVWLSRTVEVQDGQQVVDKGLYGIVRHPMYAVTVWLFLSMPLVLESWWALLVMLPYPILMALRIKGEEELLERELVGYAEYKKRVPWKMVPFIW